VLRRVRVLQHSTSLGHCYDPGRSRPRPRIFCMPVLSLFPQQIMGSRCRTGVTHDWLGYKSPDQMAVVERWVGRRIWIEIGFGVSLVLECRRLWIIVVVCLYYHLPDCTLHLLFLFITLIFTTRLL